MRPARGRGADTLAVCLHPLDAPHEHLPITGYRPYGEDWSPREAGVLVPILEGSAPEILLTVRSRTLAHHAGQVSFPGGGRHAGDTDLLATALRETREETGIPEDRIEPLGYLDRYDTLTGYRMLPVVARILGRPELRPCPGEVETVFTVPLAHVLDPDRYRQQPVNHKGRRFTLLILEHPEHYIWGATAALLDQLRRRWNGEGV